MRRRQANAVKDALSDDQAALVDDAQAAGSVRIAFALNVLAPDVGRLRQSYRIWSGPFSECVFIRRSPRVRRQERLGDKADLR